MSSHELSQRNRELELLTHVAQALNRTTEIDAAMQLILTEAAAFFGLETGWIWLMHPQTDEHYLAAAVNLPPALADVPERMVGWCWCIETYRDGDMASAEFIKTIHCTRLKDLASGKNNLNFHVSIPLNANALRLGLLNLASAERRELADDEMTLLHTLGDMLAVAVERNRLFAQSRELGVMAERNRLARELHDTLAQSLTGIALQLESAEITLAQNPNKSQLFLNRALTQTRNALSETRRSVHDLRATALEDRTLCEALRQLGQSLPIQVHNNFVDEHQPLSPGVAMGLYRIAGEALSNVVQHAQTDAATLQLVQQPKQVTLIVQDAGVGFNSGATAKQRYGLIGMAERAKLLGGQFTLDSKPGTGTTIEVFIPL